MYKCIAAVVFVAVAGCLICVQSQASYPGVQSQASNPGVQSQASDPGVDVIPKRCMGCLCEAVSNCNHTRGCHGEVCGLFHITWRYWSDSGKPTQPEEDTDAPQAFSNCVTEPFCAERAMQGYMAKFQQDCNLDGKIDCLDYALIHKLGGYGCKGTLPEPFGTTLTRCLARYQ